MAATMVDSLEVSVPSDFVLLQAIGGDVVLTNREMANRRESFCARHEAMHFLNASVDTASGVLSAYFARAAVLTDALDAKSSKNLNRLFRVVAASPTSRDFQPQFGCDTAFPPHDVDWRSVTGDLNYPAGRSEAPHLLAPFAALALPVWAAPSSARVSSNPVFAYFRSPLFVLPVSLDSLSSLILMWTAETSPNVDAQGTTQSKLLGSAVLYVNGVALTAGPGHAAPASGQPVRMIDLLPLGLLRAPPSVNVIAVRSYFEPSWGGTTVPDAPRLAVLLQALADGVGPPVLNISSGSTWSAWDATSFHNPTGDATGAAHWYHVGNEWLDTRFRPLGWESPGFDASAWAPAVPAPAFARPYYLDAAPPPAFLARSACAVTPLPDGSLLLDFGQELMGGPNLTFASATAGARLRVLLGEELRTDGSVYVPARSAMNYSAVWTLSGGAADAGILAHEFVQFRYAQLAPFAAGALPSLAPDGARAWVVQAPFGGDGTNPWENPCARSMPLVPARRNASHTHGKFSSSSAALDAVWALCAYTCVATALDVNVDSQTRQRDLCHVDALITAAGAYAVNPAAESTVAERSARFSLQNSSNIWASSFDFKASTVLIAALEHTETGTPALAAAAWAVDDSAIDSDSNPADFLSLQFLAGLRYSGDAHVGGLLRFPAGCGGSWSCDPLVDWPASTRDGYVMVNNSADAVRNGLAAAASRALAGLAAALGHAAASSRYAARADSLREAMLSVLLRVNGSESYFVDGADGDGASHAAVHSTIYAVAGAGVADAVLGAGPLPLAVELAAYLRRRDTGGSSCMTARYLVEALYRLGASDGTAADQALDLLSRSAYPSWGDMLANGATTTFEAWRLADKSNADLAHPWCSSPAVLIPRWLAGLQPLAPGWIRARAAPQPGDLAAFSLAAPTPRGMLAANFSQTAAVGVALALDVPPGTTAQVCLPPLQLPGSRGEVPPALPAAGDSLLVDGAPVVTQVLGRLLCTLADVDEGVHTVVRAAAVADFAARVV